MGLGEVVLSWRDEQLKPPRSPGDCLPRGAGPRKKGTMKKTNGNGTKIRRTDEAMAYDHGTKLLGHLVQRGWWQDVSDLTATMKRLKAAQGEGTQAELPLAK